MTPFLWCAVIGCGILALSLVLDGLMDGLDGFLFDGSLPVIATALGVFGAVGAGVQAVAGQTTGQRVSMAVLIGVPLAAALVAGAGTRALWVRRRRSMPRNAVPLTPGGGRTAAARSWRARAATNSHWGPAPRIRCAAAPPPSSWRQRMTPWSSPP